MPSVSIITFNQEGQPILEDPKTLKVKENEILFEQLDDQGVTLPHGCLSGSCGSCRVVITQGASNLSPAGAVERDTLESLKSSFIKNKGQSYIQGELRLSCRAKVCGDITFGPI